MIQNLNLGPPLKGMPTLKASPPSGRESDEKTAGSESFGKALQQKMAAKEQPDPKEGAPTQEAPVKELRAEKERPETAEAVKDPQDPKPIPEAKDETQKQEGLTVREKAIKKFMDSFESEFGIPPTRLVEAIAHLKPEEQMKAPEDTAKEVIAQLGLNDKDQERAQAMYAALLVNLSKTDAQAPSARMNMAEAARAFGQEFHQRIQNGLDQRSATNMGVERLNQRFWMKQPMKVMADGVQEGDGKALAGLSPQDAAMMKQEDLTQNLPPHLRGQLEQNASPALMAALAAKIAQNKAAAAGQGEEAPDIKQSEGKSSDESGKSVLSALVKKSEAPVTGGLGILAGGASTSGASHHESKSSMGGDGGAAQNFAKNAGNTGKEALKDDKLLQKGDFKQALHPQALAVSPQALHNAELAAPAVGAAALASQQGLPTPAEHETNIRQLMNQAQYLIKKGGGEVKVQMTPEGLGPVHLKVMLQDGKVNVQMSAATDDAKKTIESSLADLKTSLAAHKLSVDHVKVDVVNNTSTDTATNNQMNHNAQRDSTRQFWNQFNDNFGSQSQRNSFLDMADVKGYGGRKKTDPLQPIEVSSQSRGRAVEGKGQGLNLVA